MNTPFPLDFIYDIETIRNWFLCVIKNVETKHRWIFEISPRVHQANELYRFLMTLKATSGARMVGFNNEGFDYPVIHYFIDLMNAGYGACDGATLALMLHNKGSAIIHSIDRFEHSVWPSDRHIPQVDLYKIHHFDNRNKSTGLKALEFNMQMHTVADMPHDPNADWTPEWMNEGVEYCCHDVDATEMFYFRSIDMIKQRADLNRQIPSIDFTNFNDTKIGKKFFINELETRLPGVCFSRDGNRKVPRMTYRRNINLGEIIFPYVTFQTPEFQRGLAFLKSTVITDTKAPPELDGFNVTIDGFQYDIGAGGIHGSRKNAIVRADADHEILDVDVASYYPNLAIKNRVYPEHLTDVFCDIYEDLYQRRKKLDKKSSESAMLKLALNGVYGESNSAFPSPFVDPKYTMTITFNGQLLLCMLAEKATRHPGVTIIQINTDGMTCRVRRDARAWFDQVCEWWQALTRLELETVNYAAMFIRDVNNYIAVTTDGNVKRKGEYQHDISKPNNPAVSKQWQQDWSALVVPKAAEAALVNGQDVGAFIRAHTNPFDFMLRAKPSRGSRLAHGDRPLKGMVRYVVAKHGDPLFKIMPPLAKKGPDAPERTMAINKGWNAHIVNHVRDWRSDVIDYDFYIEQARKLIDMKEFA